MHRATGVSWINLPNQRDQHLEHAPGRCQWSKQSPTRLRDYPSCQKRGYTLKSSDGRAEPIPASYHRISLSKTGVASIHGQL
jgi:hypothetical protein